MSVAKQVDAIVRQAELARARGGFDDYQEALDLLERAVRMHDAHRAAERERAIEKLRELQAAGDVKAAS